jgi:Trypsin-like peptidase domain
MLIEQTLETSLVVRQDFRTSVRFVMFDSGMPEWQYATHGGTAFLVVVKGQILGLTCRHVLKDFEWRQLVLTDRKFGQKIAGIRAVYYASEPTGEAVESDMLDIVVVQFSIDVGFEFFGDAPYILDQGTIGTATSGDKLFVNGAIKEHSIIDEEKIAPVFCYLEFVDSGSSSDVTLRQAKAEFNAPKFSSLAGISGSPVFNSTSGRLCGIVTRGNLNGNRASIHYVDIFDVTKLLSAVATGVSGAEYQKTMKVQLPI